MAELPTGTVTFLLTDIEGSTQLWEQHPDAMRQALARHDALLAAVFARHGGQVVKSRGEGDSLFAVFARATDAVAAALTAQRALLHESWPLPKPLRVRMALHTGEAELRDGDYYGVAVSRCARLRAMGHGGQVLLSQPCYDLVRDTLPLDATIRDLGEHRLRDLTRPERVFHLGALDLPDAFPSLRSLDARPHNLPVQPTALIGRETEIEDLTRLLRGDARLVTLTGPGGTGKTRLALQGAAQLLDDFPDGVYLVGLAPISDPALVPATIAQALGVKEGAGRSLLETLTDDLRTKQRLLVLDNFEQLLPAAPVVGELLAACPKLTVLVTSRAALHLSGEHEVAVPPLRLPARRPPPPVETLSQYAAVALFIARATAVRADFAVTNATAPAVAEICYRLDGLPLAIELAAARLKVLTPQALLTRLEHRLTLLTGGPRDLPARQQTLRDTIAWSYDLLAAAEQVLFRRLAVFVGGCTLAAAEAVCGGVGILGIDVLEGIASLVDKSLLQVKDGPDGEPRYMMLETVREYATERLEESGEADALRRQHAAFALGLAEEAEPHLYGVQRRLWLARLTADLGNLRAALAWSRERPDATELYPRLTGTLYWFWYYAGHWTEGRDWAEAALARTLGADVPRTAVWAKVLWSAAASSWDLGDYATARSRLEASLVIGREQGDPRNTMWPLFHLGVITLYQGDANTARALFAESAAHFREAGDTAGLVVPLVLQGDATAMVDRAAARALYEESLAVTRAAGDTYASTFPLTSLGRMALEDGEYATARARYEEGLVARREVGEKWTIAISLASLGDVARCERDHARAAALFDESLTLSRDVGPGRTSPGRCAASASWPSTGAILSGQQRASLRPSARRRRSASSNASPPAW